MTPDPQTDLAYIRQVMEQTRRYTVVSGSYFVAWGLLISLGLAAVGITHSTAVHLPLNAIWIALIAAGWLYSFWQYRRESQYRSVAGYAKRMNGYIWIACGTAMTTAFILGGITGAVPDTAVGGLSALFLGIGTFMTGVLTDMKWFRNLSAGWWLGAVAMFIWSGAASVWISAALMMLLFVAPGIILSRQARLLRRDAA